MHIEPIPLLADNYAWLLWRDGAPDCAVVDPSTAGPVRERIASLGLTLRQVLATHHHYDHVGGIEELVAATPGVEVVASEHDRERVPGLTRAVGEGERLEVIAADAHCLLVPGHTLGAVAYHLPAADALFTGDTLFTGGCGRLFEGTAAQMHDSLSRLAALPASTRVYCGHEYTVSNLRFAATLEPDNPRIARRLAAATAARAAGEPTVPATLEEELATNPFLRVSEPALRASTGRTDPAEVLAEVRARKDAF